MIDDQQGRTSGETSVGYQPCLCRETLDRIRSLFTPSTAVKQHLVNSRIEFLKAVQTLIDERIQRLSRAAQPGTTIPVD
jgi:hypothetical protein